MIRVVGSSSTSKMIGEVGMTASSCWFRARAPRESFGSLRLVSYRPSLEATCGKTLWLLGMEIMKGTGVTRFSLG